MNAFDNLVEGISVYEVVNNIIPGSIYVILVELLTDFTIIKSNKISFENIVLVYFIGLVISRMGSLLLEPFLRKRFCCGAFLTFAPYKHFLKAKILDKEGSVRYYSMINNMYRCMTMTSLCVLLTVFLHLIWNGVSAFYFSNKNIFIVLGCFFLIALFGLSYRKQTEYLRQMVEHILENNQKK